MSIHIPEVSSQQVADVVRDLDTKGIASLPNYIDSDDLKRMQAFVASAIERSEHEYVHFNGPDTVSGSGLEELGHSPRFARLMYDLYEQGTGKAALKQDFYQVLRCLAGNSGQKNSLIFHYDSYVVTALVPIEMSSEGRAGDLLIYPNTRKIRSSYMMNACDKVLLDNPITQRLLRACINFKQLNPMRVKLVPGHIYFFWGYRSIHTNEACDPGKVRATALFHYANPHRSAATEHVDPRRRPVKFVHPLSSAEPSKQR
jgi:hypothetical protein